MPPIAMRTSAQYPDPPARCGSAAARFTGSPDGVEAPLRDLVHNRTKEGAMNIGLIVVFAVVIAGALFVAYGLIRPFTHIHYDHRDAVSPPHLD